MFTEHSLRRYPALIKAFTGIPAEEFWKKMTQLDEKYADYEQNRHERPHREREVGGGRPYDQPLVIRVMLVLTYLRLHVPQPVVALLFGCTQSDVCRELRRLLPLIQAVWPCPEVWEVAEADDEVVSQISLEQLSHQRALVDATEQPVERAQDKAIRKHHYSGKKKQFTLKTQLVSDDDHHIVAISQAVPGACHDKKLADDLQTVQRLPDGCEADGDKGYQGLSQQVEWITLENEETGEKEQKPRITVKTPFKKPRGGELTPEQKAFNQTLNAIRVRIEHCIGWMKNWAIVATRFRCDHAIYTLVLQTVCGFVNAQTQRWQAEREVLPAYCE